MVPIEKSASEAEREGVSEPYALASLGLPPGRTVATVVRRGGAVAFGGARVGARNMQKDLPRAIGKAATPVLLKRAPASTIEELLLVRPRPAAAAAAVGRGV